MTRLKVLILGTLPSIIIITCLLFFFLPLAAEASENNADSDKISVQIDVSKDFAKIISDSRIESNQDGILYKVTPGENIQLPKIEVNKGYYFVGWSQGGVSKPTWNIFTKELTIDEPEQDSNTTYVYALYADKDGNGYCSCGDYKANFYTNDMTQIIEENQQYNNVYNVYFTNTLLIVLCLSLLITYFVNKYHIFDRKKQLP